MCYICASSENSEIVIVDKKHHKLNKKEKTIGDSELSETSERMGSRLRLRFGAKKYLVVAFLRRKMQNTRMRGFCRCVGKKIQQGIHLV